MTNDTDVSEDNNFARPSPTQVRSPRPKYFSSLAFRLPRDHRVLKP